MKALKIKFGLFSLLAVLAISVFMTSCGQEEVITNEITESNLTELAERLANDTDYQAVIEIRKEINVDLTNFVQENGLDAENNPSVLTDFVNAYPAHKEQLDVHSANLKSKFPELTSLTKDEFSQVSSIAFDIQNELSLRDCWDDCHDDYLDCDADGYALYLAGICTYQEYLAYNRYCARRYFYPCVANC